MSKLPDIKQEIAIPENVEVKIEKDNVYVKGEKGEISRRLSYPKIKLRVNSKNIEIECKNPRKKEKALLGTFAAHIKNMLKGVTKGFEYKMKTVFSHFPIKTTVEGNEFLIQNFLGERSPRRAKILDGVTVVVKDDQVIINGINKEKVGQTVANIERATTVRNRDVRVFQDGVYRISKGE
jgi:large subunit ribosomal protein L6